MQDNHLTFLADSAALDFAGVDFAHLNFSPASPACFAMCSSCIPFSLWFYILDFKDCGFFCSGLVVLFYF